MYIYKKVKTPLCDKVIVLHFITTRVSTLWISSDNVYMYICIQCLFMLGVNLKNDLKTHEVSQKDHKNCSVKKLMTRVRKRTHLMSVVREPGRKSNLFKPPGHQCIVTYMTKSKQEGQHIGATYKSIL